MTGLMYISVVSMAVLLTLTVAGIVIYMFRARRLKRRVFISRFSKNPILKPNPNAPWENAAVFNPAAVYTNGRVHLFYRALGNDGISRIGYAVSADGIHFERSSRPAFAIKTTSSARFKNPFSSSTSLRYDTGLYASCGGWGGSEDPRAVLIEGRVYMTFGVFESWESLRIALTSIGLNDIDARRWNWAP